MPKLEHIDTINLPTWAASYLINGDSSGISDEDQATVDQWLESLEYDCLSFALGPEENQSCFTHYPEFGLPCDCKQADLHGHKKEKAKYSISDLKAEFNLMRDPGDPWGSSMELHFAIASELYWRGEATPESWQYSPGLAADPRESDNYYFKLLEQAPSYDLLKLGEVLHRYERFLDYKNLSY